MSPKRARGPAGCLAAMFPAVLPPKSSAATYSMPRALVEIGLTQRRAGPAHAADGTLPPRYADSWRRCRRSP
jgi:hypothetical protein